MTAVRGPIRYAQSGDVSIAYQVTGDGPFDLVLVPGFISHLEFDWEEPRHAAFLERLASFSRLIRLDKRGTGLSDRHGGIADLETTMDDVRVVMDAVGTERAALLAYWEGGPMAVLFAATYPERTRALVLASTFATPPNIDVPEEQRAAIIEGIVDRWGDGETIMRFAPDADDVMKAWWGARERVGGSPGAIRNHLATVAMGNVHDALPSVQAPTLVLRRTDDPMHGMQIDPELANVIPGARFIELPGSCTLPWVDAEQLLDEVEEFLTGARPAPVADRVLATILFTDIVGSTETARRVGDSAWSRLVEQHHAAVRRELDRSRRRGDRHRGRRLLRRLRRAGARDSLRARYPKRRFGAGARGTSRLAHGRGRASKGRQASRHCGKRRGSRFGHSRRGRGLSSPQPCATSSPAPASRSQDSGDHELKGLGERRRIYAATLA